MFAVMHTDMRTHDLETNQQVLTLYKYSGVNGPDTNIVEKKKCIPKVLDFFLFV
jgi:hypothetical protein